MAPDTTHAFEAMLDFARIELSAFRNARTSTPRPQPVTFAQFLDAVEQGRYTTVIARVRALYTQYKAGAIDKSAYQGFKQTQLEAITVAGIFADKRQGAHLQTHQGLLVGDLDDLEDPETVRARLQGDPHIAAILLSPGGGGLKVIARIPRQPDAAGHRKAFLAFADYMGARYGVTLDPSGKDVNRLCYVSADPHVYRNPAARVFAMPSDLRPQRRHRTGQQPGDALNAAANATWWQALLETHGWTLDNTAAPGGQTYWTRPGKETGVSASLGFHPEGEC